MTENVQKEYTEVTNRLLEVEKELRFYKIKKENNKMKLYNTLTKKKRRIRTITGR